MNKIREGFCKADSENLPVVDQHMHSAFLKEENNFTHPEVKNVKAVRNGRESYGESAIGNVQLKRYDGKCTVLAAVCLELSCRSKSYLVQADIDVENSSVLSVQCLDCKASEGGCKHGQALLYWLYRKTENPSVTEVESYWKKSKLSRVGTTLKYIEASSLTSSRRRTPYNRPRKETPPGSFLKEVIEDLSLKYSSSYNPSIPPLLHYFDDRRSWLDYTDLHRLYFSYKGTRTMKSPPSFDSFLSYCQEHITEESCREAEKFTSYQSKNPDWFKIRYGRITASKLHETSRCKTDGTLVNLMFGATKLQDTAAMKRGRDLEELVIKQVEQERNLVILKTGLMISPTIPFFGASPDGITNNYVIEVKCPLKESTVKNYLTQDGKLGEKCYVQVQLQMHLAQKRNALFCVASPSFERDKRVKIVHVQYDEEYLENVMDAALIFWEEFVWPVFSRM